jgi:hypothetical protein
VSVVPAVPDASPPTQHAVDRFRHTDGEALYTAREPRRLIRLDQQVEMIGLDTEMEEAEGIA